MTSLTGMFDGEGPVVKTFHPHAGNSVEQVALSNSDLYTRSSRSVKYHPLVGAGDVSIARVLGAMYPTAMSLSSEAPILHVGTQEGVVQEFAKGIEDAPINTRRLFDSPITSMATQGAEHLMRLYAASGKKIKVVDLAKMEEMRSLELQVEEPVRGLYANNSNVLVVRGKNTVYAFERDKTKPEGIHRFAQEVVAVTCTKFDGQTLLVATKDGTLTQLNYSNKSDVRNKIAGRLLAGEASQVRDRIMSISDDGLIVVEDGTDDSSSVTSYGIMDETNPGVGQSISHRARSLSYDVVRGERVGVIGGDRGQVSLVKIIDEDRAAGG